MKWGHSIKSSQTGRNEFVPKHPVAITISDCLLAHQMGYIAIIHDGKLVKFQKEKKGGRSSI